jgi:hypothetical protein
MSRLYVFTGEGNCRSCHAPILWFRTPNGKSIPIDQGRDAVVQAYRQGDTVSVEVARLKLLPFCHFETCPDRAEHRR